MMHLLNRANTLADARAFMQKALDLLDDADALECGAQLDKAIRSLDEEAAAALKQ